MENRITGKSPLPIMDGEVDLSENQAAMELCEQVNLLTAEAREGLLLKALAVSNEKCNKLVSQQNALIEELTRQVKSVKWSVSELEWNLKDDNEKLLKDLQESNNNLLDNLKATIRRITEVATQIQAEINIATARATEEAAKLLNKRINEAADKAIAKIDEQAEEIQKKVNVASKEVDRLKEDIHFERGFRKFFFWATPVLLLTQTIMIAFALFA